MVVRKGEKWIGPVRTYKADGSHVSVEKEIFWLSGGLCNHAPTFGLTKFNGEIWLCRLEGPGDYTAFDEETGTITCGGDGYYELIEKLDEVVKDMLYAYPACRDSEEMNVEELSVGDEVYMNTTGSHVTVKVTKVDKKEGEKTRYFGDIVKQPNLVDQVVFVLGGKANQMVKC